MPSLDFPARPQESRHTHDVQSTYQQLCGRAHTHTHIPRSGNKFILRKKFILVKNHTLKSDKEKVCKDIPEEI